MVARKVAVMETVAGIATDVTHSTVTYGEYGERVLHVANFVVNGVHKIRMEASSKASLSAGELVAVAGTSEESVFKALAYENLSSHEKGNVGKYERLFGSVAFFAFSISWANAHVSTLAAAAGVWCLFSGIRISLAERRLRLEVAALRRFP